MRPILSTRPMSAHQQQQAPKSRAVYDFTDQIQNLKEKELNLEKAKTNLYLAAENQRHLQAVQELTRKH